MTGLALNVTLSYLLGSIVGGLVIGRVRGVDIRTLGSGNPGTTNALRTQGRRFALGVIVIDVAKGWLATRWVPGIASTFAAPAGAAQAWLPSACGAAVVLGHVYPVWFGFRGGKGFATLIGAVLGLAPLLALGMLATWMLVVAASGFVSLASMLAALAFPAQIVATHRAWMTPWVGFSCFCAALVLWTHRANIVRISRGREPRATRLWLFKRYAASASQGRA